MRNTFHSIEEGKYAQRLFDMFGKERVEAELEEFLKFDFFPRSGGGIGITRMIRAMQLSNLIEKSDAEKASDKLLNNIEKAFKQHPNYYKPED